MLAKKLEAGLTQIVGWQAGDELSRHAKVGQGYGYVGFAAAKLSVEAASLPEALPPGGRQSQHDLTEGDDARGHG
jgi:hypothetical protein